MAGNGWCAWRISIRRAKRRARPMTSCARSKPSACTGTARWYIRAVATRCTKQALEKLQARDALYACACSRREIADSSVSGVDGLVYPGTCRAGIAPGRAPRAWRVKVDGQKIEFNDAIQGSMIRDLAADFGDFVVRRADGFFAYQLAVVVDDAAQGITANRARRGPDRIHAAADSSAAPAGFADAGLSPSPGGAQRAKRKTQQADLRRAARRGTPLAGAASGHAVSGAGCSAWNWPRGVSRISGAGPSRIGM